MLVSKDYRLVSNSAMLLHNGQLANPRNPIVREMKKISGKRGKTDADFEELAHLEFLGGLYLNDDGPIIPAQNVRGMLIRAARKRKEGKLAESGVFCLDHAPIEYDGPRDPEQMWKDGSFAHQALVVVSRSRIVRTRPIFESWTATVTVNYDDDVVNEEQLDNWFNIAGHIIGIGDWRPQFGRFSVA